MAFDKTARTQIDKIGSDVRASLADVMTPIVDDAQRKIEDSTAAATRGAQTATGAATVAQAMANFRATLAEGVAAFPVGAYFSSAETGSTRVYKRIAAAPGYEDQGDAAAPVSQSTIVSATARQRAGAELVPSDIRMIQTREGAPGTRRGAARFNEVASPLAVAAAGFETGDGRRWLIGEEFLNPLMLGAVPDISVDSSAAIQACIDEAARTGKPVVITASMGAKDLVMRSNVSVIAFGQLGYDFSGNAAPPANGPEIRLLAGGTTLFKMSGVVNWTIVGIHLSSTGRIGCAISGGGRRGTLDRVFIRGFAEGIGGGSGDKYFRTTRVTNCLVSNCDIGAQNFIDCYVTQLHLNACRRNIGLGQGSNNNAWIGGKVEFSEEYGVTLFNCDHNRFVGVNFDRAGWNAIRVAGTSKDNYVSSCDFFRSGARAEGLTDGKDAHWDIDGTGGFQILGGAARQGVNDDGSGYLSPKSLLRINVAAAVDNILIAGVDVSAACTGSPLMVVGGLSTQRPPNWRVRDCFGYPDEIRQTVGPWFDKGRHYWHEAQVDVAAGATITIAITRLDVLGTFSGRDYTLRLNGRDQTTGGRTSARMPLTVRRDNTTGQAAIGAAFGAVSINSSTAWNASGAVGLVVTASSPLADGTGFTLSITNNAANTHRIDLAIER